jgi:flavin reductase (DIM6/NTAB) family NADH-FMN oxidoreductase RutF
MPIDEAQFRQTLSRFASGVTVVTTVREGQPHGMTVASFASLSLNPPLVLVCIDKGVKTHDAIAAQGQFAVNILGQGQTDISLRFATKADDKFTGVAMRPGKSGLPLIESALATLECSLRDQLPGGDHTIFVGEVEHAAFIEGRPLIYFRAGYHQIGKLTPA